MMAEIMDSTNRARGFAYLPMIWSLGSTIGPIIGGVFSMPADHWPAFQHGAFWRTYPYFLPCVVTACISISAFVFALVGLKETLPRTLRQKGAQGAASTLQADPETTEDALVPNATTSEPASQELTTICIILVPRVLWPILNYGFLTFMDQCVQVLVPLMYSTSIPLGGLGFSSFTIGLVQGVAGFVGGIAQIFAFPWMHPKLGSKWLYMLSYSMFVVMFALFPLLSFMTKRAGKAGAATWVLMVVQLIVYLHTFMTWAPLSASSPTSSRKNSHLRHPFGNQTERLFPPSFSSRRSTAQFWRCICGSDHTVGPKATAKRQMPYDNLGCDAFVRMVATFDTTLSPGRTLIAINELWGCFTHSTACNEAVIAVRDARLPLHPDIRAYAGLLLRKGVSGPSVYVQANAWAQIRFPPIKAAWDPHHRFIYLPHDTSSIYRTLKQEMGIPQRSKPHKNIHTWFQDEEPTPPLPELTDACLFYQPFVQDHSDRFILIISTAEQRACAWRYGHEKVVLVDLTFGFSSARANVWIVMVIDEDFKGIPVAYILFSVKEETSERGIHADYNKALLQLLLSKWVTAMGTNSEGEVFRPKVGISDNDIKERSAMMALWPQVRLLLCFFHTWQSWRAALNRSLGGIPKGEERTELRARLARFCMCLYINIFFNYCHYMSQSLRLRDIVDFEEATAAFKEEQAHFKALNSCRSGSDKKRGTAGIKFLNYLSSFLATEDYWKQWSRAGVLEAAAILGIAPEEVPRTTNHLESHNNHLKGDYFADHTHGGRLPRLDVWVIILVTCVIPNFFFRRQNMRTLEAQCAFLRIAPHARSGNPAAGATTSVPQRLPAALQPAPSDALPAAASGLSLTVFESELFSSMLQDSGDMLDSDPGDPDLDLSEDSPLAGDSGSGSSGDDDFWLADLEIALKATQIAPNLTCLTPPHAVVAAPSHVSSHDRSVLASPNNANTRTIVMQELLLATDHAASLLKQLWALGVSRDALAPYISPWIATALGDTSFGPLEPSPVPPELRHAETPPPLPPATPSPDSSMDSIDDLGPLKLGSSPVVLWQPLTRAAELHDMLRGATIPDLIPFDH
ncbi:hypothetical protein LXA43DRAFT_1150445 [Ganoderma leucocontextum]|nr:hypothetical protein LXA43DRAFT_1150445 [Ganoderma leucocontextum]